MSHPHAQFGLTRRAWLKRAGLGVGMSPLAALLAKDAARPTHHAPKATAIISLFMHGGPSAVDTFDPKPELTTRNGQAPPESTHKLRLQFTDPGKQKLMASRMTFRKYGRADIPMADAFRRFPDVADEITLIRSMKHDVFNHSPALWLVNTGHDRIGRPSLGAWAAYGLGHPTDNLPAYVVMAEGALKTGVGVWGGGFLPTWTQGTLFDAKQPGLPNLTPPEGRTTTDQRAVLDFAQTLNRKHAADRPGDADLESRIQGYESAFKLQSAAPEATDLTKEPRIVRDEYGPDFGEQCLIARRLVERGVKCIQIYHGGGPTGWDTHTNNHTGQVSMIRQVDRGMTALIADLKRLGMLDRTLVTWGGEFGRTPTSEASDGRDHNPYGFSTILAGGGVKAGHIYGATDELGFTAAENPVAVHDLNATILHLLGFDHEKLTFRHQGRDFRLTDTAGEVIRGVLA